MACRCHCLTTLLVHGAIRTLPNYLLEKFNSPRPVMYTRKNTRAFAETYVNSIVGLLSEIHDYRYLFFSILWCTLDRLPQPGSISSVVHV